MSTATKEPPLGARLSSRAIDLLCCPICHSELESLERQWCCENPSCGVVFPSVDGAPILVNENNSVFDVSTFVDKEPTFFKKQGLAREWLSRLLPDVSTNVAAKSAFARLGQLLKQRGDKPILLIIGGGVVGAGLDELLNDPDLEIIETDAALEPRTQLICDAHDLPLKDHCVDGVVVQAVLEHVVNPTRCVDEIYRVLKSDGLVYSDTPFMQQVHGREFDFSRYTRLGHRRLFRRFAEVSSGVSCGPAVALAWALRYFLLSFFVSSRLRMAASGVSRVAFFWLKYFDHYLAHRPGALDAASSFYFLGRKSHQVLDDRQLVASYRGGF